ncbi:MAG: phosphoenolpyruvate--protein phosphotransferase [Rhodospirillales bacterium]
MAKQSKRKEIVLDGLGVSPGIAIGAAYIREHGAVDVPERQIAKKEIDSECRRIDGAAERAIKVNARLRAKSAKMPASAAAELDILVSAYDAMLRDSRLLRGAKQRIAEELLNAEAALHYEINAVAQVFAAMDDAYIASRVDDIREVGRRLLLTLTRTPVKPFASVPEGSVLVSDELTPADTARLDSGRIAGAAAVLGGAEGHTAILARAIGLPTVLGVGELLGNVKQGDTVMIDGTTGRVVVNPSKQTVQAAERTSKQYRKQSRQLERIRDLAAETRDGVAIHLQANVELPVEMDLVQSAGAEGIGLLRTEFMFMNRDDVPDEDEQVEMLRSIVERAPGPVTIRTLDIGGEKPARALMAGLDEKATSALGMRGIRLSLHEPAVLETQMRAILRVAAEADRDHAVRILLPMVSTVGEVRRARDILNKAAAKLKRRKVALPDPMPALGVMIEVPGAALAADALARNADFFAIGSNDLTMYTLAIDRSNEYVAGLYDPLHPAVLRLVQFSAGAAQRAGIPVSICGEMAGDPRFTPLLVGLGFRELSMAAQSIPKVKQRVRKMDSVSAERRAQQIMDQVDPGRIAALIDDFSDS